MKISYNWLKDYLNIDLPAEKVSEILTDIGLEVEGLETFESVKGGLAGLVIGEVVTCEKHPDADRLSVTKVNIGGEDHLSIVCGAPNVAAGQKVVVATVGTTLYDAEGEPWKIKKGKIRGSESHGMICAEDEIGLGKSHDGILVLPDDVAVGTLAKNYFEIEIDTIFEIGLTPNRSDATGHFGVAFDLAAALKINYEMDVALDKPSVAAFKEGSDDSYNVTVENTESCPRYSGIVIKDIKVKSSPEWLVNRLEAVGVRAINNIVDITNYILHELGQPLHAFDLKEIEGNGILVKNLPGGTSFLSLDEVERKLNDNDLMICDAKSNGLCIAGVFGGVKSGVKEQTTSIFLESAHFEAGTIRRTSMKHLLRTDAATRFEKGTDPNATVYALKRAALLIQELAEGTISSKITDIYPNPVKKAEIEVSYSNINRLIGAELTTDEVKAILTSLEIEILKENDGHIVVSIPTNKADVLREADVIEEVLRIYGFNKVVPSPNIKSSISYSEKPDGYQLKNRIGDLLAGQGFNEMMGLSLTQSRYYKEIAEFPEDQLVYINNTSNQHLDVLRPQMLFSGLESIVYNQNRKNSDLRLFEFGKTYEKGEAGYVEQHHLSLFLTGKRNAESWLNTSKEDVSYHTLKAFVDGILSKLGIKSFQQEQAERTNFAYCYRYFRGNQELVTFGKVKGGITKKMDIKQDVFYADFNWDSILKALKKHKVEFSELAKYPFMRRDLALVLDRSIDFAQINGIAQKTGKKLLQDVNLFDVYESTEHLGEGKKSYSVSFIFQDKDKTLKDKDVDKIMNKLMAEFENKLGALIRR